MVYTDLYYQYKFKNVDLPSPPTKKKIEKIAYLRGSNCNCFTYFCKIVSLKYSYCTLYLLREVFTNLYFFSVN